MNDEQDTSAGKQAAAQGPRGGERLAEARREQQISVLEIAKELHLDETKVRALENNEFEVLGAPVFAKGHLRKYAQLVGVDQADVFADYYAMTRATAAPPVVVGRKRMRNEISPGPWIALVVIVVVAAGAYWWFFMRDVGSAPLPAVPARAQPGTAAPVAQQPQDVAPQPAPMASPQTAEPQVGEALADNLPDDELLPAGQVRLSVTFSGDCWTEITDADGRRLFVNMGRGGQSVDLTGRAPVTALFGNADNVSLSVDGAPYPLPAPTSATRMVRVAITSR